MVALQEGGVVSPSLIEVGARKLASVRAARRDGHTSSGTLAGLRRAWDGFLGIVGTLAALVFFVTAAFHLPGVFGSVFGWAVAGVAMLLLDFKVSLVRRANTSE